MVDTPQTLDEVLGKVSYLYHALADRDGVFYNDADTKGMIFRAFDGHSFQWLKVLRGVPQETYREPGAFGALDEAITLITKLSKMRDSMYRTWALDGKVDEDESVSLQRSGALLRQQLDTVRESVLRPASSQLPLSSSYRG